MSSMISINPANYEVIGEIKISTEQEIKKKVQKAQSTKKAWRDIGAEKRLEYLRNVYDVFRSRENEFLSIAVKEVGFPKKQLLDSDFIGGLDYFKWFLENLITNTSPEITFENKKEKHTVYHDPLGVAAVIQPWSFPFSQWVWSVVPNLAVGNTVVFKHSKMCQLSGKFIEEIVNSILPEGVFEEVYGDSEVGELLLNQDINLICFTGSTKTGRKIYELAGKKFIKSIMEMGGSAPGIIFEDVDISEVLENIYWQRFSNNGQSCDGLKRLLVHESIFNSVVEKFKILLEAKKIGDPEELDTDFGPLGSLKQRKVLIAQVKDAINQGAKVVTGGKIPEGLRGAYFQPTILTNISRDMRVWKEEVFGPVLPVMSFKSEEEAIKLANDTEYGLGGYVYSNNLKRAERVATQIDSGMIGINGINYICPFNPFGGYKMSGKGRENGKFSFSELTQIKVIASPKAS